MTFPIRCDEIRERLKLKEYCCGSCHSDEDEMGYALCGVDFPDGTEGEACCAVANEAKEKLNELAATTQQERKEHE